MLKFVIFYLCPSWNYFPLKWYLYDPYFLHSSLIFCSWLHREHCNLSFLLSSTSFNILNRHALQRVLAFEWAAFSLLSDAYDLLLLNACKSLVVINVCILPSLSPFSFLFLISNCTLCINELLLCSFSLSDLYSCLDNSGRRFNGWEVKRLYFRCGNAWM